MIKRIFNFVPSLYLVLFTSLSNVTRTESSSRFLPALSSNSVNFLSNDRLERIVSRVDERVQRRFPTVQLSSVSLLATQTTPAQFRTRTKSVHRPKTCNLVTYYVIITALVCGEIYGGVKISTSGVCLTVFLLLS